MVFPIKGLQAADEISGVNNEKDSIETTTATTDLPEVESQLQRLSALIVGTTPDDLPVLAAIHGGFQEIAALRLAEGSMGAARLAESGVELISQIILRERDDAAEALEAAGQIIREMQGVIDSGAKDNAPFISPQPAAPANSAESAFGATDTQLVYEFIGEAGGHLDAAEEKLLSLEKNPGDLDAVNAVFRGFHTIKGVAGFLNLKQIGALAHVSENLLDLARHGKMEISGHRANVVLEAADMMRTLLRSLDESVRQGIALPEEAALPGLIERLKAAASGDEPVTPVPAQKAANAPAAPAADRRQNGRRAADAQSDGSVKVATERLDALINMVGELVIAESMVSLNVVKLAAGNHRLLRNVSHLTKITRELQDLSMAMRMVPVQRVFQKMTRLVRDVAQKAGKEVELVITGGETELDRNVVEAMSDPLVHMVRNSIDHGIEPSEQRSKAGKSRIGTVHLKAEHKGGNILIQISDDGRGLNKEKIVRKAIENGVVREGQELSEQEIFRLIFHAGLSTAEKVTDISGRGVGMDVVKRDIEALRGRVDIASTPGQGTVFSIVLPLTLAVIDGLLARVGDERFILPITSVERSLRPKAEQISTVRKRGELCLVRGELLPLYRLHRLFDIKPRTESPSDALVVIVRDNERQCCVLVDELLGQQQVVIKSLGDGIGHVRGISGGAILGDGNVSLILDIPGIIDLATKA
jgi:two-component system chemotaxis sensor kinase CheA